MIDEFDERMREMGLGGQASKSNGSSEIKKASFQLAGIKYEKMKRSSEMKELKRLSEQMSDVKAKRNDDDDSDGGADQKSRFRS